MDQNRRKFLRTAACAAASLPVLNELTKRPSFAQIPLSEVSSEDPIAKALGYHSDGSKVDPAAFPKRAGPDGQKQFCSTCMLLVASDLKVPGSDGVYGRCSVIQAGLVNTKGWCNSWVQRPGS